jgi:hypothetical protein
LESEELPVLIFVHFLTIEGLGGSRFSHPQRNNGLHETTSKEFAVS